MIKLFKKKPVIESVGTIGQTNNNNSYPEIVQEIHKEFFTASDKLLTEALDIIAKADEKNLDKIKRLEALGLNQCKEVVEIKPLLVQVKLSKDHAILIQDYKKRYPFNKFITEEQVKEICNKYNLVCGKLTRFKGFVPEKNLSEIEKFNLKEEDYSWFYSFAYNPAVAVSEVMTRFPEYDYEYFVNEFNIRTNKVFKQKLPLQICAPVKDMDISGLELVEGYKLQKKHIPDPVVLQPVENGYLIVTAWGDEASDPIVVNEINN